MITLLVLAGSQLDSSLLRGQGVGRGPKGIAIRKLKWKFGGGWRPSRVADKHLPEAPGVETLALPWRCSFPENSAQLL